MHRYFIAVAYRGNRYAGFQIQKNAATIQSELEKVMAVYFRHPVPLTGSSRTDAGVHGLENYFHFDIEKPVSPRCIYNLNAMLPGDIAVKCIREVHTESHCRFDAIGREYRYRIYQQKDPFQEGRAYFFPYTLDLDLLQQAAGVLLRYEDFTSFAKRGSQVKTFNCNIAYSRWTQQEGQWIYEVRANRFLRGMVRGLVGTMLQVGRGKLTLEQFEQVIRAKDNTMADFSVPGHGLYLLRVLYPDSCFIESV